MLALATYHVRRLLLSPPPLSHYYALPVVCAPVGPVDRSYFSLFPCVQIREKVNASHGNIVVEAKFDGERIQLHKDGDRIVMFSRRCKDSTGIYYKFIPVAQKARPPSPLAVVHFSLSANYWSLLSSMHDSKIRLEWLIRPSE